MDISFPRLQGQKNLLLLSHAYAYFKFQVRGLGFDCELHSITFAVVVILVSIGDRQ